MYLYGYELNHNEMNKICLFVLLLWAFNAEAQIMYQNVSNKNFSLGSYGRVGADWSFENGASVGRRLNLNNMGSVGGRLEEQDYMELVPALHFNTNSEYDSSQVNVQFRIAAFSRSLSLLGNSTSSSLGGLTFGIPEIYAEGTNIGNSGVNMWVGSRLYRGADVHIADHFYFNDHSGQGFGVEYKKSRFCALFIASSDTSATVPPYFYLNIETGTPAIGLRQRLVLAFEHDFSINKNNQLTILAEYHNMGEAHAVEMTNEEEEIVDYPFDFGFVFGARLASQIKTFNEGSYNQLAIRYGNRLANGGDGGLSRTWLTYGAPNRDEKNYAGAYSLAMVDEVLLNLSSNFTLNAYSVFTYSKGGADTNGMATTYKGKEVYNRKIDFTIGMRNVYYLSNIVQLMAEAHYSQRKDGVDDVNSMFKVSLVPTIVPTGYKDYWARPHLRFVMSLARYNDAAMKNQYSPYLDYMGERRWGTYVGMKAEWYLWN